MTPLTSHLRHWTHSSLRAIAPRFSCEVTFAPDDVVWNLTLDQIQSGTGNTLEQHETPYSEAGSSSFIFDEDTVLYSKLRPYLNKVVWPRQRGVATTELVPLKPDPEVMLPGYLAHYLRSPVFLNYISNRVAGAKMPRVVMDEFWSHEIPHPVSTREQARIVELLDEADALRRQRVEADANLTRVLPAFFRHLFGEIVEYEEPDAVPLSDFVDEPVFGISAALSANTDQLDGQIPVLRMANISKDGYLTVDDLRFETLSTKKRRELNLLQGDLLFNWRNSPYLVGKTAIFDAPGEYTFASFLYRLRVRDGRATPEFIWHFLNSLRLAGWFETRCRQAVSQANFGRDELLAIKLPPVPLEKQLKFSAICKQFFNIRRTAAESSTKLETMFQTLLHRAFTGELTAKWREAHLREGVQDMSRVSRG